MTSDKHSVLIVDDEISLLNSLIAFFEDENFDVLGASTGEEALAILESHTPDAVVLDMRLPGIDGNEVVIKAKSKGCNAHFFIHTGSTDYTLPKELLNLGMQPDHVFHKPVSDLGILTESVSHLIVKNSSF
jgi:DNA-binding response OmpR family regulator